MLAANGVQRGPGITLARVTNVDAITKHTERRIKALALWSIRQLTYVPDQDLFVVPTKTNPDILDRVCAVVLFLEQVTIRWLLCVNDLCKAICILGRFDKQLVKTFGNRRIGICRLLFEQNGKENRREQALFLLDSQRRNPRRVSPDKIRVGHLAFSIITALCKVDVQPTALRKFGRINFRFRLVDHSQLFREQALFQCISENLAPANRVCAAFEVFNQACISDCTTIAVVCYGIGRSRSGEVESLTVSQRQILLDGRFHCFCCGGCFWSLERFVLVSSIKL